MPTGGAGVTKCCRFCRKSDGDLTFQPADPDFQPGRRNYRARGFGPSYYHGACLIEFQRWDAESKARRDAEFAAIIAEARASI
jgi:hypothetical protein